MTTDNNINDLVMDGKNDSGDIVLDDMPRELLGTRVAQKIIDRWRSGQREVKVYANDDQQWKYFITPLPRTTPESNEYSPKDIVSTYLNMVFGPNLSQDYMEKKDADSVVYVCRDLHVIGHKNLGSRFG